MVMGTVRRRRQQRNEVQLGITQELALICGGTDPWPGDTDEERLEACRRDWFTVRDQLIADHGEPGERFAGWWLFEQGRPKPRLWIDEYRELKRLRKITAAEEQVFERRKELLGVAEGVDLAADWRKQAVRMHSAASMRAGQGVLDTFEEWRLAKFSREWHAERGRDEFARQYQALMDAIVEVEAERQGSGYYEELWGSQWSMYWGHVVAKRDPKKADLRVFPSLEKPDRGDSAEYSNWLEVHAVPEVAQSCSPAAGKTIIH
jgi:hypothetical protein